MSTAIPYLDEVWNVATGCGDDLVSPGCTNCYARRMTARNLWGYDFTPTFHPDRLDQPLRWRRPRRIGVCFMGDLFHEAFTDEEVIAVFDVMRRVWNRHLEGLEPHTFLLLTKRPERMQDFCLRIRFEGAGEGRTYLADSADARGYPLMPHRGITGLANVHLGVTITNQLEAERNIPVLLATPAAVRWVSYEPALEAVDFSPWLSGLEANCGRTDDGSYGPCVLKDGHFGPCYGPGDVASDWTPAHQVPRLDWVVLGGETGPGARPMQLEWAESVFRQCRAAGVPFYWKQGSRGIEYDPEMVATRDYLEVPR